MSEIEGISEPGTKDWPQDKVPEIKRLCLVALKLRCPPTRFIADCRWSHTPIVGKRDENIVVPARMGRICIAEPHHSRQKFTDQTVPFDPTPD
jgi:hypothetical protein